MATAAISFVAPTFLRRTLRALTVPQVASFNSHPIFHSHSLPLTISPSFYSGICHVVHAFKGDANDVLLKGVADKNTVEAVKHILEMVCWEKFARYFEVELKEVKLREGYYVMDHVKAAENTICVAAILGSTLTGEFEADLPEEFIFHINYLGADQPTFTLNFLKGSSQIIAQYYQFIRLGYKGYKNIMKNCMENANVLKESLEKMGRFEIQAGYQPRLLTLQPLWMK